MKNFWVLKGLKMLLFIAFFTLAMGTLVTVLWNWLMPSLFNLPVISFGQAVGLLVLSRILTGSFRLGMGVNERENWEQKKQMYEKMSSMSSDERAKFKSEWRDRCRTRRPMGYKNYDEETPKEDDHI